LKSPTRAREAPSTARKVARVDGNAARLARQGLNRARWAGLAASRRPRIAKSAGRARGAPTTLVGKSARRTRRATQLACGGLNLTRWTRRTARPALKCPRRVFLLSAQMCTTSSNLGERLEVPGHLGITGQAVGAAELLVTRNGRIQCRLIDSGALGAKRTRTARYALANAPAVGRTQSSRRTRRALESASHNPGVGPAPTSAGRRRSAKLAVLLRVFGSGGNEGVAGLLYGSRRRHTGRQQQQQQQRAQREHPGREHFAAAKTPRALLPAERNSPCHDSSRTDLTLPPACR